MKKAYFRFYEELNDFLPGKYNKIRIEHNFIDRTSIKDMIESIGVPHTEIDLILVNSKSKNFSYIVQNGDDISVYPVFESFDISDVQHLRPKPIRQPKFILDVNLGKLAKFLRMTGIDVLYENNYADEDIVKISLESKRTILTRDLGILKRREVSHGYFVRNIKGEKQLIEVVNRFHLQKSLKPFSRCIKCNSILNKIEKNKILNIIPSKVKEYHNDFYICEFCNKIYWRGTHFEKMCSMIEKLIDFKYS